MGDQIKEVIIHTSDSEWGNAVTIDSWHRWRKFKKIGYHYVILNGRTHSSLVYLHFLDGSIEVGRAMWTKGAHCRRHNKAIGICLIGKNGNYTEDQMEALKILLLNLKLHYGQIKLTQHSDYDKKKPHCAGLELQPIRDELELAA